MRCELDTADGGVCLTPLVKGSCPASNKHFDKHRDTLAVACCQDGSCRDCRRS